MEAKGIYRKTILHFLAPIQSLLADESVSEVLINGPECIYFERAGKLHRSELQFSGEEALMAAARNIAEFVDRRIDADNPNLDARLPDGSRVHILLPPSSRQGVCISIRKFHVSSFDLRALVERGSLSEEAQEFLEIAVALHKNIIISGGTGTGKTSILNALSAAISESERIIVIEDSSELQLRQPHSLYLEAQPARPDGKGRISIRDLFRYSLRMRPDRIVVGEVRGGEALDMVQAMLSGHAGALATLHANSPYDAVIRLETMCLMSDVSIPIHVARTQIASAIHLILQLARFNDGSRRVQAISELMNIGENGCYQINDIYRFQARSLDSDGNLQGELLATGNSPSFRHEPIEMGFEDRVKLTKRLFLQPQAEASE